MFRRGVFYRRREREKTEEGGDGDRKAGNEGRSIKNKQRRNRRQRTDVENLCEESENTPVSTCALHLLMGMCVRPVVGWRLADVLIPSQNTVDEPVLFLKTTHHTTERTHIHIRKAPQSSFYPPLTKSQ